LPIGECPMDFSHKLFGTKLEPIERSCYPEHFDMHLQTELFMVPEILVPKVYVFLIKKCQSHWNYGTSVSETISSSVIRCISKCSELHTLSIGTSFVPNSLWENS